MPSSEWSPEELAVALDALLLRNQLQVSEPGDCTVLDVRADGESVLVTFRFMSDPHVLGYRLGPGSVYTEDGTVPSVEDWAAHAQIWLEEQLGTGFVVHGARRQRDGFLELSEPGYPVDERFYSDTVRPTDGDRWAAFEFLQQDGFDTSADESLRAAGTLISWERAYLNNRAGAPWVGHAAIVRTGEETAHLALCEVTDGVPDTVMLWLCLTAAHAAAWQGARVVTTDMQQPVLDVLGFRLRGEQRKLATDFLQVDHRAAARLIQESSRWRPSWQARKAAFRARWTKRFGVHGGWDIGAGSPRT